MLPNALMDQCWPPKCKCWLLHSAMNAFARCVPSTATYRPNSRAQQRQSLPALLIGGRHCYNSPIQMRALRRPVDVRSKRQRNWRLWRSRTPPKSAVSSKRLRLRLPAFTEQHAAACANASATNAWEWRFDFRPCGHVCRVQRGVCLCFGHELLRDGAGRQIRPSQAL